MPSFLIVIFSLLFSRFFFSIEFSSADSQLYLLFYFLWIFHECSSSAWPLIDRENLPPEITGLLLFPFIFYFYLDFPLIIIIIIITFKLILFFFGYIILMEFSGILLLYFTIYYLKAINNKLFAVSFLFWLLFLFIFEFSFALMHFRFCERVRLYVIISIMNFLKGQENGVLLFCLFLVP